MTAGAQRNTGYKFDLVDQEAAEAGDHLAQMGNYDSRHEAIGMKVLLERRLDFDYEVRHFESMWREAEEPAVCDWCGHEDHYRPLVSWTFASGYGEAEDDGGAFCSKECYRRWCWSNYPDALRRMEE